MLIAIVPIIVCVIGLLMWALASHDIVKKSGMIMFAEGLLVTLFVAAKITVRML